MRFTLIVLAAAVALALAWLWLGAGPSHAVGLQPAVQTPAGAHVSDSEEDVMGMPQAMEEEGPSESRTTAAAAPTAPTTVPRPAGFSELVVLVRAGTQVSVGAVVEVSNGAEAVLNGTPDDEGRAVTDGMGEIRFFVRPTRTVVVKAAEAESPRTSEGTFTSTFEGRSRAVLLDFGEGEGDGTLKLRIVSELGGAPLSGANVIVEGLGQVSSTETKTDHNGIVLVPDDHRLEYQVFHEGFSSVTRKRTAFEIDPSAPAEQPVDLVLRPLSTLRGRIDVPFDGPVATTREDFEKPSFDPRAFSKGRRVLVTAHSGQGRGGTILSTTDSRGGTSTIQSGRFGQAAVLSDGTWTVSVAIEQGLAHWQQVQVMLINPDGSGRVLGWVDRLWPGDDVVVPDPWSGGKPLSLSVRNSKGEPTAMARKIQLSQVSVVAAQIKPVASGEIDDGGGVDFPLIPKGDWNYMIEVEGAPPSWSCSGTFTHAGSQGPVVLSLAGDSLTVKLVDHAGQSLAGPQSGFSLGVAEGDASPVSRTAIRPGEVVTFPRVPPGADWSIVLQPTHRHFTAVGLLKDVPDGEELLRVRVEPEGGEILLDPE